MIMQTSRFNLGPLSIEKEGAVCTLIRNNLMGFDEQGSVLVSTFRRLRNLHETYLQEGCSFWVACESEHPTKPIACVGLGPLHGLPLSEGVGEIRDLVVDTSMRGQGLGKLLLDNAVRTAKAIGYRRLYLETSKSMVVAQKLFESRGFRPVIEKNRFSTTTSSDEVPCYYLLETL